jgi:hypothetical protein
VEKPHHSQCDRLQLFHAGKSCALGVDSGIERCKQANELVDSVLGNFLTKGRASLNDQTLTDLLFLAANDVDV